MNSSKYKTKLYMKKYRSAIKSDPARLEEHREYKRRWMENKRRKERLVIKEQMEETIVKYDNIIMGRYDKKYTPEYIEFIKHQTKYLELRLKSKTYDIKKGDKVFETYRQYQKKNSRKPGNVPKLFRNGVQYCDVCNIRTDSQYTTWGTKDRCGECVSKYGKI